MSAIDKLDIAIRGAKKIGALAGFVDDNGCVDVRATYYALERGLVPADKNGRQWVTTPRRILNHFAGKQ